MLKVSGPWSHGDVLAHPDAILDQLRPSSSEPEVCWPEVARQAEPPDTLGARLAAMVQAVWPPQNPHKSGVAA
jgi:hypothetical protein